MESWNLFNTCIANRNDRLSNSQQHFLGDHGLLFHAVRMDQMVDHASSKCNNYQGNFFLFSKIKINMKKLVILAAILFSFTACTENSRVKNFGGEGTINLPKGRKLVNVTWKETQIWYLTRPMDSSDVAQTYQFHEESSYGVMEGTYNIIESK